MHQRGSCGPEAAAVMVVAEPQAKDADCAGLTEPNEDGPCMSHKQREAALRNLLLSDPNQNGKKEKRVVIGRIAEHRLL